MISKTFVLAGRAVFTVEPAGVYISTNHKRGTEVKPHYTFRVVRKEAKGQYPEAYFVSLLAGPDNTRDYQYLGLLKVGTGAVALTKSSKFKGDSQPLAILQRVLACIWSGEGHLIEQAGWRVHHEGRCGRCGRVLTVPESVETGMGPECSGRRGLVRAVRKAVRARKAAASK